MFPEVIPAESAVLRLDFVENFIRCKIGLTPNVAKIPIRWAEPRIPAPLHLLEGRGRQQEPIATRGTDGWCCVKNLQQLPVLRVLHGDTPDCSDHEVKKKLRARWLVVPQRRQPLLLLSTGAIHLPAAVERHLAAGKLLDLPVLHPPRQRILVVHSGQEALHREISGHPRGEDRGQAVARQEADTGAGQNQVDGAPPGVAHGRNVERGESVHVRCVGVRAGLQQLLAHFVPPVLHSAVQRCAPAVISVLQRRSPLQQHLHNGQLACGRRQVQQGSPPLIEFV
mmetsp:Transcript_3773/g.8379  ORF Transcript_3773/g.8379 Transcript_3773/m.8379 type:complete len:282 (-) Transcript_3773:392-1237(-)